MTNTHLTLVSINKENQPVTTSLAIANGIQKKHKVVIQLVREHIDDLEEFGRVAFEKEPFKTSGGTQTREYAVLNEQQSALLMTYMRNNEVVRKFKKHLVRAFYELRDRQSNGFPAIPQTLSEALRLAADQAERIEQLEQDTLGYDRIAKAEEGSLCVTNAAKDLQMRPKELFSWLNENAWIYRRSGKSTWVGYQDKIQRGYLEHKVTTITHDDGTEKILEQVLIKPKGLTTLAKTLSDILE